ncbi:MAG TPA: peptidoglycan recognition family protein [Planctomycetota bacterium]|nr:peptidoglycan recognition family protein [Planctomycetota bacterium]
MRAGIALTLIVVFAGCQSSRVPQVRETSAELPSRTYVSVHRLADKLELDYLGEADGFIEMSTAPDYIMLARDSRNAVVNGESVAMGHPCLRRGDEYVVSAGDAELVTSKLATLRAGRKPVEQVPLVIAPKAAPSSSGLPVEWQPLPGARTRDWQAIVIHHAAMTSGSAAVINKVHLANPGWDGLGYHFVIGNGTQSGDGEVEVGFRWKEQREGAHARARKGDDNRWNLHSIGICLVGDFTTVAPSQRQMDALVRLVRALMAEYGIPAEAVVPHHFVHATECPGARFPWGQFMARLQR